MIDVRCPDCGQPITGSTTPAATEPVPPYLHFVGNQGVTIQPHVCPAKMQVDAPLATQS